MGRTDSTTAELAAPVSTEAQLARYDSMIMAIPAAVEDGGEGMVLDILNATSWEDVNVGDKLPALKDLIGQEFIVQGVERRAGDEQYGKGWYLVLECVKPGTGETFRAQTSAGVPMAQLVKLHHLDVLPCTVRVESKVTGNGQTAINLRVVAANGRRA